MGKNVGVRAAAVTLSCALVALNVPATADDNGSVNATVTVPPAASAACIVLNSPTVTFGTLDFGQVGEASTHTEVTSCADGNQTLFVKASHAASTDQTAFWTLVDKAFPGVDEFRLITKVVSPTNPELASNFINITTTDQTIWETMPVGGVYSGDSIQWPQQLAMPAVGSQGAGKTMNFQIVYTAAAGLTPNLP